jgi:hypothetical protein
MGKNYNSSRLVNGLSVDASGNVAIGIATPTTRLTIGRVDSSSEGGQIDLCRASDNFNAWGIDVFGNTTTPSLRFIDNVASAARMVITGAGNVGIGNSSPMPWGAGFLGLSVGQASVGCLPTTANSYFTNNIYYDGAFRRGVAAASSIISMNEDVITFANSAAGTAGGTITFNERMRITGSGNVGINLTGPTGRFHIYSNNTPTLSGTSPTGAFVIQSDATTAMTMGVEPTNPFYGWIQMRHGAVSGLAYSLALQPLGGNVGIGVSGPTRTLVVSAAVSGSVTEIYNTRNNSSGDFVFVTSLGSNAANTSSYHYIASTGGSDRFYVYGNGNVVNTNNSYGPLSDIKLKENIVDATPKLDKLMQVRIVNYNLIGDDLKQIGVIAQELEQVFPGLVDEHPDRDAEGNQLDTTTKSVKMSVFVPMLIKAIQELKGEVDSLKAQINN